MIIFVLSTSKSFAFSNLIIFLFMEFLLDIVLVHSLKSHDFYINYTIVFLAKFHFRQFLTERIQSFYTLHCNHYDQNYYYFYLCCKIMFYYLVVFGNNKLFDNYF